MKQFLKFILLSLALYGCSGGSGDDNPTPPVQKNNAPTIPILVYPANNLLCISNILDFEWNASSDIDGDGITYKIEIAKDNQFSQIAFSTTLSATKKTYTLEKGIAYYWRVQAVDSKKESSNYSTTFNLYTEGVGVSNHLPFAPELVKPEFNSTKPSGDITLEWLGSDADNNPLTFDVYFGTTDQPGIVSQNQDAQIFVVSTTNSTTYYWKVVVKDDKGGEAIGQIWTFHTN
ncbi:fibronectin type III domain-containing protein [Confluentibacter flavum]|uniref:Fibronectin type-III domain-containing protein n=1 Tax=Confluentibacter flavum TaxID=1909700 RepID=A0A2N3HHX2_9FLAO|nr:hypothetical protein [Confluentibacter flavum]PKQ44580.1 hypothetical protein CSW08_12520 [Confluentibacter flavum]